SLSGSPFERGFVGDEIFVIKHISRDLDWLMRVLGDGAGGTRPRALTVWQEGLLDALPPEIDPVIVGMAYDPAGGPPPQVMPDPRATLVPPDGAVPLDQHRGFVDHMAAMHTAFWGFTDAFGLTTTQDRYGFASLANATLESGEAIPAMMPAGWAAV